VALDAFHHVLGFAACTTVDPSVKAAGISFGVIDGFKFWQESRFGH